MSFAPDAARGLRHVFVRGLTVQARLGVHAHEEARAQRVVIGPGMSGWPRRWPNASPSRFFAMRACNVCVCPSKSRMCFRT